jgi:hypothetical protein
MGFNFRKSKKILPGLRINLSKNGLGVSAGIRGARASLGATGRKTLSAGIPGSGLSYRKTLRKSNSSEIDSSSENQSNLQNDYKTAKIVGWAFVVVFIYAGFTNFNLQPVASIMCFVLSGVIVYLLRRKKK